MSRQCRHCKRIGIEDGMLVCFHCGTPVRSSRLKVALILLAGSGTLLFLGTFLSSCRMYPYYGIELADYSFALPDYVLAEYRSMILLFVLLCIIALNRKRIGVSAAVEALKSFLAKLHLPRLSRPLRNVLKLGAFAAACLCVLILASHSLLKLALAQAIVSRNTGRIGWLLRVGANPNEIYSTPDTEYTPLIIATEANQSNIVELLLEHGAKVNAHNGGRLTPLMAASYRGNTGIVKILLDRGADIHAMDNEHNFAIHYACHDYLQRAVAAENGSDSSPVQNAILLNHRNILVMLLNTGSNVNEKDGNGDTPLLFAAGSGSKEYVRCLIERGADLKAVDEQGKSAVDLANESHHPEIVDILKKAAAK